MTSSRLRTNDSTSVFARSRPAGRQSIRFAREGCGGGKHVASVSLLYGEGAASPVLLGHIAAAPRTLRVLLGSVTPLARPRVLRAWRLHGARHENSSRPRRGSSPGAHQPILCSRAPHRPDRLERIASQPPRTPLSAANSLERAAHELEHQSMGNRFRTSFQRAFIEYQRLFLTNRAQCIVRGSEIS